MENELKITHYYDKNNWNEQDRLSLRKIFEENGSVFSKRAALGEGAGGTGFETEIHILIDLALGVASNIAWEILKTRGLPLLKRLLKALEKITPRKKAIPKDLEGADSYRAILYIENIIVGIDLNSSEEDLEAALEELDTKIMKMRAKSGRLYQNGSTWDEIVF